jgi:hypothetical protein
MSLFFKKNKKQMKHAMLILAAQWYSACRAMHFWLILSPREHPGAFRARSSKNGEKNTIMCHGQHAGGVDIFLMLPPFCWVDSGMLRKSGVLQGSLY